MDNDNDLRQDNALFVAAVFTKAFRHTDQWSRLDESPPDYDYVCMCTHPYVRHVRVSESELLFEDQFQG